MEKTNKYKEPTSGFQLKVICIYKEVLANDESKNVSTREKMFEHLHASFYP